MIHELRVFDSPEETAAAAAEWIALYAATYDGRASAFTLALSGGKSPWLMLDELAGRDDVDWAHVRVYQVDERVAPDGDDRRNLTHIDAALGATGATIEPMAVNDDDLEAAARLYAERLPALFDLVHLGLGPDGHCASLIPDDPILDVTTTLVGVTGVYQDTPRMTLTYPALERASHLLWLVTGADKVDALAKLLDHDPSIPAGRVVAPLSLVMADAAAAGR